MLSAGANAYLTGIGPGTAMGALLRRYWIPLLYSQELDERDGGPLRIRLLGESLIAFRDGAGRVGLLDHHCPHRGASLFYGRNEAEGIRCLYHGWQFDVDGRCLDIPNEPGDCPLLTKVRATAYPCREANGIIWTYMGPGDPPPLPTMGWAAALPARKTRLKYIRHCNWVQAMEGDFDSSHLGFLHRKLDGAVSATPARKPNGDALRPINAYDTRPRLAVEDTAVGVHYAALRSAPGGEHYWRVTQFHLPFYTSVPAYDGLNRLKIWVPMDDGHTMVWEANWRADADLDAEQQLGLKGRVGPSGFLPETDDWYGRGNFAARAENDYLIDRARQRDVNFSGMEGATPVEDAAMQESMGAIVDRTREHLSASDAAIIRLRKRLMAAAEALEQHGASPPGVTDPSLYHSHGEQALGDGTGGWQDSYARMMAEIYAVTR
jgi:phenylpropionate dioxygenase-like ring-hydroxylating dioxygenase large terminal subunit